MSENATCCSCGKSRINPDKHRCIPELKEELNEWQRQVCGQGEVISLLNDKLFAADATIAALRAEVERLTKKLERSYLYRNSSYWQEKAMAVLRGEFTQCCSYCGWEAPPPNGWEELQKHIEECPEHPLPKLRARLEAAEAAVGILQKSTVSLLARAEQAEKELAAEREKVEKAIEWRNENIINYCPECSLEIDIIDWDALEQILQGTDK